MISFHTIGTIAKYEMRTLLRAWFFRIFAALTIFSLAIYNMAIFLEASGAPWIYRAIPAALPYANLIILNLGQAVVAVFLASEFLKQDKKNDTVEVIYARSMTNSEYILGKAFGVLAVFFILNIIVLLVGIGFSFLSSDSSRGVAEYFFYPLLISLPTLVYIVGLSFLLMVTIKNQAVTFILLTGYIALSIFYLNNKFYSLPDFIAYNVPMMLSTISGFGQFGEMMLHRGIYFCLGLSFIFFTVYKLARLPQSIKFQSFTLIIALFFLAFGGFLIYRFIEIKQNKTEMKQKMIEINNLYASYPIVQIDSCYIKLDHKEDKIFVDCDLLLYNKTGKKIDTLILSLNPSIVVQSITVKGSEQRFSRNLQILKVVPSQPFRPDQKIWLSIKYSGKIDENVHFLEQDLKDFDENFVVQIYSFRKHYAWIKKDFVCLTSESFWYPVSGVGYSTRFPDRYLPDFTNYELEVKTEENLYALSQGVMTNPGKGKFHFRTENPIPQLSLLIGNYIKYSLKVDSVEYNLVIQKGNDYFKNHFNEVKDSLSYLIRELKNEYEARIGFKYPFNRLSLAEVPAEFCFDKHPWSISSNAVQPEILFIPEKGIYLAESDFKRRKKREEDRMKRENEEVLPEELQARIFKKCMRNNFMAEPDQYYDEDIIDQNTYTVFPEFFSFIYQIRSEKWPILNTALQSFIKERNSEKSLADFWWRSEIGKAEQINLELKQNSLNQLIKNGITKIKNEDGRITLNELILVKGEHLFSLFRSKYGIKKFDDALDNFLKDNQFEPFSFSSMDSMILQTYGKSISNEVDLWYNQIKLPGFLIKDLETYRIRENEFTKYQIRFKISNSEPVDGLITVFIEMAGKDKEGRFDDNIKTNSDFSKKIYLPANTSKEIGLVFPAEPARMRIYTHISENLPNNLIYDFSSFNETRKSEAFDSLQDISFFSTITIDNEYVVDNEDSNFTYSQSADESYLKSVIKKAGGNSNGYKYSRIRSWNPPGTWKPVIESEFYGKYIRSAIYTKSGEGDRKATWNGNLKNAGNYDVYCHIVKITNEWQRNKEKINYNFIVYHDEGSEEISLFDEDIEDGWVYLGTFYITPGKAMVELNNRSIGNMVFADAVKWVKSK